MSRPRANADRRSIPDGLTVWRCCSNRLARRFALTSGGPPDLGDLRLALICVPHSRAAEALNELGLDIDQLWGETERARARLKIDRQAFAKRLGEMRWPRSGQSSRGGPTMPPR